MKNDLGEKLMRTGEWCDAAPNACKFRLAFRGEQGTVLLGLCLTSEQAREIASTLQAKLSAYPDEGINLVLEGWFGPD